MKSGLADLYFSIRKSEVSVPRQRRLDWFGLIWMDENDSSGSRASHLENRGGRPALAFLKKVSSDLLTPS